VTQSSGPSPRSIVHDDARLAEIVRSAHDAIVGETLDGTVTVWNRAAEDLYGYPAVEMVGQRADRLYPLDRRAGEAATVRRIAGGHRVGGYVTERIRRDGTPVRVSVRAAPIVDGTGVATGVATISWAVDVDAQDALVGFDPAGRTGHELRTSLNAIVGFTGTLLLGLPGPLNAEQQHQLQLVQESAAKLLTRINQLSRPSER
jgi:PAS domain S-box-containing protein